MSFLGDLLFKLIAGIAAFFAIRQSGVEAQKKEDLESTVKAMETRNEVEENNSVLSLDQRRRRLFDDAN